MVKKRYSTFPRSPEFGIYHHQMQVSAIARLLLFFFLLFSREWGFTAQKVYFLVLLIGKLGLVHFEVLIFSQL